MVPGIPKDSFKVVLVQKRMPDDLNQGDVVMVDYYRSNVPQQSFAGRVFGKPGDLLWVEQKIVSPRILMEGMEVRREKPSREEEGRFLPVIVPRDSYFVVCDNRRDYAVYDSRGVGPVGIWAVKGKIRN
jgi:signal peptidase I